MIDKNHQSFSYNVHVISEFTDDVFNISQGSLVSGTIFIPTRWNQGCFDAVYYELCTVQNVQRKKFLFLNATLAHQHNYNFQFIANFLQAFIDNFKINGKNIDVSIIAVTSSEEFSSHNVNAGRRDNVKSVKSYYKQFDGTVTKYHIPFI